VEKNNNFFAQEPLENRSHFAQLQEI
jgi:hypothetical protein